MRALSFSRAAWLDPLTKCTALLIFLAVVRRKFAIARCPLSLSSLGSNSSCEHTWPTVGTWNSGLVIIVQPRWSPARASALKLEVELEGKQTFILEAVDCINDFSAADLRRFGGKRRRRTLDHGDVAQRMVWLALETRSGKENIKLHKRRQFARYLTHLRAYMHLLATDGQYALILEDRTSAHMYSSIINMGDNSSSFSCWDLLIFANDNSRTGHTTNNWRLKYPSALTKHPSALTAYFVSRHGAEKLVFQLAMNSDKTLEQVIARGAKTQQLSIFELKLPR